MFWQSVTYKKNFFRCFTNLNIYLESSKNVHSAWPTVDYVPHFTTQHEAHKWPNVYKSGQASAICLGWVWQHIQVAFGKDEIRTHNKSIQSWVGQLLHRTYAQKTFFCLKQFALYVLLFFKIAIKGLFPTKIQNCLVFISPEKRFRWVQIKNRISKPKNYVRATWSQFYQPICAICKDPSIKSMVKKILFCFTNIYAEIVHHILGYSICAYCNVAKYCCYQKRQN